MNLLLHAIAVLVFIWAVLSLGTLCAFAYYWVRYPDGEERDPELYVPAEWWQCEHPGCCHERGEMCSRPQCPEMARQAAEQMRWHW